MLIGQKIIAMGRTASIGLTVARNAVHFGEEVYE
jgi:hypothetical protein